MLSISKFTKILPVGTALTHFDRQTDTKKVIGTFHNYVTADNNKRGVQPLRRQDINYFLRLQWQFKTYSLLPTEVCRLCDLKQIRLNEAGPFFCVRA